jgi:adenylate cyclase
MTVRLKILAISAVLLVLGAPTAKSFAAIGDITNLASRLEGVNKVYRTIVIAAEETYRLAQHAVEAREMDAVVVVGKSEPVRIFEIIGRAGEVGAGRLGLRDLYAEALAAYRAQEWSAAERRFAECLRVFPDCGAAGVLRDRSTVYLTAPPRLWDVAWRLTEK